MGSRGIPTKHAGVTFRSRGEAKWAVFLDHLDLKWEYEPQGYNTDGSWYLPDFAVFAARGLLWVEIKPDVGSDPAGEAKFRKFAAQRPQPSRAALLAGTPGSHRVTVLGGNEQADSPLNGPWEADDYLWRPCPSGQHFDLAWPGRFRGMFAEDDCEQRFGGLGEQAIEDAISAAMSAKFVVPGPSPEDGTAA